MKKIQLFSILLLVVTVTGFSQLKNEVYLTGNYVLIPHNYQEGTGYSVGFNHQFSRLWWLTAEYSYSQAINERGGKLDVGGFTTLPLISNTVAYLFSVTPAISLPVTHWLNIRIGAGIYASYQSSLNTNYRYIHYIEYPGGLHDEEIIGVDFREGYHIGSTFNLQSIFYIKPNWSLMLKGSYFDSSMRKSLTIGVGVAYTF